MKGRGMKEKEEVQPAFVSTEYARKWLGVSRQTMNVLIRTGEIEAVRLPGMARSYRIRREALEEYASRAVVANG